MRKSTTALLALALVSLLVFVCLRPKGTPEPTYAGYPLSFWLQRPDSPEAQKAIRTIGTNGIPFLLHLIHYEPPKALLKIESRLPIPFGRERLYQLTEGHANVKALVGFSTLGTNAAPAIPALVSTMKDPAHPDQARRAIFALSSIGPDTLPYLSTELSQPAQSNKDAIVLAIFTMASTVGTNACLPPLLKAAADQDPLVRRTAVSVIRHIDPEVLMNTLAK